jgi:hypothetical protein
MNLTTGFHYQDKHHQQVGLHHQVGKQDQAKVETQLDKRVAYRIVL